MLHGRCSARAAAGEERGAVAVLFALLLVAMFTMVAIVIDLGHARTQRRSSQQAADLAALAAGIKLPFEPATACDIAWRYLAGNLADLPAGASTPCGTFPLVCDASAAVTYEATGEEPYQIWFRYPLPDDDAVLGEARVDDGLDPCERMAVHVTKSNDSFFAGVIGVDDVSIGGTAVVRSYQQIGTGEPVALAILDPFQCDALTASGRAQVRVLGFDTTPGRVTVDSDATARCLGDNTYVVDAQGIQNASIESCRATCDDPGLIEIFAMEPSQTTCGTGNLKACDPTDVAGGRLFPQPIRELTRLTRAPVDHNFNCRETYDDYHSIEIAGCPEWEVRPSFVDQLETAVGGPEAPAGFSSYSTTALIPGYPRGGPCSTQATDPPVTVPAGNWFVDCSSITIANTVTFAGGNVVFAGGVTLRAQGQLSVNAANTTLELPEDCIETVCATSSSAGAAFVYLRDGDFVKSAQSSLILNNAIVYLADTSDGTIRFGAGDGVMRWLAPTEGPFKNLALWSESGRRHDLGGQTTLQIEGAFFTPEADPFRFTGQGGQEQEKAQFISYRLEVAGQGVLQMETDPERMIPLRSYAAFLIR